MNKKDFIKYCAFNLAPKRYEDFITFLPNPAKMYLAYTITCQLAPRMPISFRFERKDRSMVMNIRALYKAT